MSRFFLPTVVCASIKDDANQLAMALGEGPADADTWSLAQWTKDGQKYATRNLWVRPEWVASAQQPLQRPEWDADNLIDMAAAERAQTAIMLWDGEGDMPMPQLGKIVCVPKVDIQAAVQAWGLEPVTILEVENDLIASNLNT